MDATEVMVLNDYSTSGCLYAERVTRTIPTNDEHVAHRPATRSPKLASELGMPLGELSDTINPLRAEMPTAAGGKKPTVVFRYQPIRRLKFV
ncbi:MAG: hypothetical protein FD161_2737 [Limisphaerales bacterium]|nr:MAG: hypothetical protein FD161_2737 [Limisphaerales bacterium]KAG0508381.1 MAG: hypothetical protein E1N63_2488 [Limisphaerales bacterium]TXT51978.1 MAG: hypothetical protein FD140_1100 [Limisphaerales bacterium]